MIGRLFDSPGMAALEQRLSWLDAERTAIAANLANVDTPGYQPVAPAAPPGAGTDFGATLGAVQAAAKASLVPTGGGALRADGNGVDVDAQMAQLSKTVLWYNAVSQGLQLGFQRDTTAMS